MHLRALTSLRFAGAMLVLLHHLSLAMPALAGLLCVAQVGYLGVTFFFVLSGFVLTYSWTGSSRPRDFYVRRAARVYPVHLLTAGLMVLMLLRGGVRWGLLPLNVILIQAWSPDSSSYLSFVGAAWSLSCEVFFYACFPLLIMLLSRVVGSPRWAAALVLSMLAFGLVVCARWPAQGEYLYHVPFFRLGDFVVGILLCLAVKRGWRTGLRRRAAAALVVTVYLAIFLMQSLTGSGVESMWLYSVLMVMPFGILIATVAGTELDSHESLLGARFPVLLGQWSFALYMVHGVVLAALYDSIHDLVGPAAVVVGIATVTLCVTVAWLVFVLYERPAEAAIRRRWSVPALTMPVVSNAPLG